MKLDLETVFDIGKGENNIKLNEFEVCIILNSGVSDTTICKFQYKTAIEFYEHLNKLRDNNDFLYFEIDDYVIEYNFDDISCIKIKPVKVNK